ncbi:MAG: nucleic acid-binding protein [Chloroflexi bacterium B3_Chlor]|nr:MAG: nucleic acid-binding protein [Chloroflexi bacterium B3_Chlor]
MRRKHVPQRTCVACRQVRPARDLIRIVRLPSGEVELDETGKKSGRGAYLCAGRACWEAALTKRLVEHALKTEIRTEEKEALRQHYHSLPTASI